MDLQTRINEIADQVLAAGSRRIQQATKAVASHPLMRTQLAARVAQLRGCQTVQEVRSWLYANQDLLGWNFGRKVIPEFDRLYLEQLQVETAGWQLIKVDRRYTGAFDQYVAWLVVRPPEGGELHFRWGNTGANGMASEFRPYGQKPEGLPRQVFQAEMLRRKIAGEEYWCSL